ncbi:MAG: response regulator [Deltaproteobacteria bacterium]|nr:response regulator [Deltaproteobacteria bacterium]
MGDDPFRYFRVEAAELTEVLERGLLALERGPPEGDLVQRLLRAAHTLKGAARIVRVPEIAEASHAIEDVLQPLRDRAAWTRAAASALRPHIVAIRGRLDTLGPSDDGRTRSPAAPPSPPRASAPRPEPVATVETRPTDARTEPRPTDARPTETRTDARPTETRTEARPTETRTETRPTETLPTAPEASLDLRELAAATAALERTLTLLGTRRDDPLAARALSELSLAREHLDRLRLVSLRSLELDLMRTAADSADHAGLGSEPTLHAEGLDLRVEPLVYSELKAALVQLVKNAAVHAFRGPFAPHVTPPRAPPTLHVRARRAGRNLIVEVEDNGRGIDLEAVAARVRALDPRADLSPTALVDRLARGGISTAPRLDGLAGRGVGLDVARAAATRLGGRMTIDTSPAGTRIALQLPARATALDLLVVEVAGEIVSVPLGAVVHVHAANAPLDPGTSDAGAPRPPRLRLANLYVGRSRRPDQRGRRGHAMALTLRPTSASTFALGPTVELEVDRVIGVVELVVEPPPPLTPTDPLIAGFAARDDREFVVLDPDALVAELTRLVALAPAAQPADDRKRHLRVDPILVIDDSLTTRMLEQSILESAGYEVELATSGEEGLEFARRRPHGLFLVDVEMPGIDGFTFIELTRADPTLATTPAILVSSRAAPEDQARGRAVGASAYIVKSAFDQTHLLALIQHLAVDHSATQRAGGSR